MPEVVKEQDLTEEEKRKADEVKERVENILLEVYGDPKPQFALTFLQKEKENDTETGVIISATGERVVDFANALVSAILNKLAQGPRIEKRDQFPMPMSGISS